MNFVRQYFISVYRLTNLAYSRKISMTSKLRESALESLKSNPYFDKYSNKILEKQKLSPEEFYSRLEEHEKHKQNTKTLKDEDNVRQNLSPGEAKSNVAATFNTNMLDKIMKIDLIKDKNADEIRQIWEEFHKLKESTVSATLPVHTFKLILAKSQEHPVFLLPLPRNQGFEFIMLQFAGNEIHFTPLISYQTHKENAPECLTIAFYPEFAEEKNIVLMKGEYDKNVINAMEAQCLANQLQLFYGENNEKRDKLMSRFTHCPDDFKHMDLIAEIESLSF